MLSHFNHVQLFATLWTVACHGILQARTLEWVAVPSCRESSWPRDWTQVSHLLHWQAGSLPLVPSGKPFLKISDAKSQMCLSFYNSYTSKFSQIDLVIWALWDWCYCLCCIFRILILHHFSPSQLLPSSVWVHHPYFPVHFVQRPFFPRLLWSSVPTTVLGTNRQWFRLLTLPLQPPSFPAQNMVYHLQWDLLSLSFSFHCYSHLLIQLKVWGPLFQSFSHSPSAPLALSPSIPSFNKTLGLNKLSLYLLPNIPL